MAELRRLLIEPVRLKKDISVGRALALSTPEAHYLKRVLRLRLGDTISVVNGAGRRWEATLQAGDSIKLSSQLHCPIEEQSRAIPLIGLAVELQKRGFDELMRMSSEIGVDIIQPLSSERSVVKNNGENKSLRREGVIREAIEQSERLWTPEFRDIIDFKDWVRQKPAKVAFAFAATRVPRANDFQVWMKELKQGIDQLWVAIGPEGGWTEEEKLFAKDAGCIEVQFGESIMSLGVEKALADRKTIFIDYFTTEEVTFYDKKI